MEPQADVIKQKRMKNCCNAEGRKATEQGLES